MLGIGNNNENPAAVLLELKRLGMTGEFEVADSFRFRPIDHGQDAQINSSPFPLCHFCVTYLHYFMQTMQTVETVRPAPFSRNLLIFQ